MKAELQVVMNYDLSCGDYYKYSKINSDLVKNVLTCNKYSIASKKQQTCISQDTACT